MGVSSKTGCPGQEVVMVQWQCRDKKQFVAVFCTGKITEQFILSALTGHVKENGAFRPSQHRFIKGRSCLTNLISFYEQVTQLVDEGKAVGVYVPEL